MFRKRLNTFWYIICANKKCLYVSINIPICTYMHIHSYKYHTNNSIVKHSKFTFSK